MRRSFRAVAACLQICTVLDIAQVKTSESNVSCKQLLVYIEHVFQLVLVNLKIDVTPGLFENRRFQTRHGYLPVAIECDRHPNDFCKLSLLVRCELVAGDLVFKCWETIISSRSVLQVGRNRLADIARTVILGLPSVRYFVTQ